MRQKDLISLRDILNRLKVVSIMLQNLSQLINKCKIHAVGNKIEIKSNNIDRSKSKIYHSRQFIPSHRKLSNIMNKNEE